MPQTYSTAAYGGRVSTSAGNIRDTNKKGLLPDILMHTECIKIVSAAGLYKNCLLFMFLEL